MTPKRQVVALVMRMQHEFLVTPALTLTVADAQRRFGVEGATCKAILDALVESGVLERTPRGTYVRFFPRRAANVPRAAEGAEHHAA